MKKKQGKCIKCGRKGLVDDSPSWWHDEHCEMCIAKAFNKEPNKKHKLYIENKDGWE